MTSAEVGDRADEAGGRNRLHARYAMRRITCSAGLRVGLEAMGMSFL